jgi:energy-coupling factor transport system ATP-binding protein
MSAEAASSLRLGELVLVDGPNFSGRTNFLRTQTGLDSTSRPLVGLGPRDIYVGPEIYNAVSGLAPTVRVELALHGGDTREIVELAEEVGLTSLFARNPVTLSGGEQAALVTIAGLALRPRILALDCALEQIEPARKASLCSFLSTRVRSGTLTLVADNRISDCCRFFDRAIKPPPIPASARRLDIGPVSDTIDIQPLETSSALELSGVSFRYRRGDELVLRNVSAVLNPGRVYHLRGANGAGKTTLAKLMCGVLHPTGGTISVGADRVNSWLRPGRIVAYHFQNPDVQLFCTKVRTEIGIGAADAHCAAAVIKSFGLDGVLEEHPLDLPFVLRKRVALAATIAMCRPWFIVDEPTLGQDDPTSHAIAHMIMTLAAMGTGVIVISHSEWFAELLHADSIYLKDGTLSTETR